MSGRNSVAFWHKHPKLGSSQLVQEEEDLSRGPVACPHHLGYVFRGKIIHMVDLWGELLGLCFLIHKLRPPMWQRMSVNHQECLGGVVKMPKSWVFWNMADISGASKPPNSREEKYTV